MQKVMHVSEWQTKQRLCIVRTPKYSVTNFSLKVAIKVANWHFTK